MSHQASSDVSLEKTVHSCCNVWCGRLGRTNLSIAWKIFYIFINFKISLKIMTEYVGSKATIASEEIEADKIQEEIAERYQKEEKSRLNVEILEDTATTEPVYQIRPQLHEKYLLIIYVFFNIKLYPFSLKIFDRIF